MIRYLLLCSILLSGCASLRDTSYQCDEIYPDYNCDLPRASRTFYYTPSSTYWNTWGYPSPYYTTPYYYTPYYNTGCPPAPSNNQGQSTITPRPRPQPQPRPQPRPRPQTKPREAKKSRPSG